MYWLVQDRFLKDPAYAKLCENLARMGINHSMCTIIPFTDDGIVPEPNLIEINEPIFTFGSHTLSKIASKREYRPGAFISEQSSMDNLIKNYGAEMFNSDMIIAPLSEINPIMDEFFIRPMEDTKSFVAEVTTKEKFAEFKNKIISAGTEHYSTIYPHTMVVVSSPKKIEQECRFFIVDGKIVSYSQYKFGDIVKYSPVVDSYIIDYVEQVITGWQPDVAFCLDVAVSNGIPKILEVNSINSSGLYAIDTQKFILAIEDLTERYKK